MIPNDLGKVSKNPVTETFRFQKLLYFTSILYRILGFTVHTISQLIHLFVSYFLFFDSWLGQNNPEGLCRCMYLHIFFNFQNCMYFIFSEHWFAELWKKSPESLTPSWIDLRFFVFEGRQPFLVFLQVVSHFELISRFSAMGSPLYHMM